MESWRKYLGEAHGLGGAVVVFGPVYHAGRSYDLHDGPIYWAKRPRSGAFGKFIVKAKIMIKKPFYPLHESDLEEVLWNMGQPSLDRLFSDIELEYDLALDGDIEHAVDIMAEDTTQIWQGKYFVEAIKKAGFDGVIAVDTYGGETEYVTFNRKQVKVLDRFQAGI